MPVNSVSWNETHKNYCSRFYIYTSINFERGQRKIFLLLFKSSYEIYFAHYSFMVIIFSNTGSDKSVFSTYYFEKLVFADLQHHLIFLIIVIFHSFWLNLLICLNLCLILLIFLIFPLAL